MARLDNKNNPHDLKAKLISSLLWWHILLVITSDLQVIFNCLQGILQKNKLGAENCVGLFTFEAYTNTMFDIRYTSSTDVAHGKHASYRAA